jgi:hypothetical protein
MRVKALLGFATSLVSVVALAVTSPVLADTVEARCDVFPVGDDKATSSGLCIFSQRQGFVTIRLKGGQTIELKPNESTPNGFFDERGEPARREILDGKRGQVYRLEKQSIFVFWDTAPYAKGAKDGASNSGDGLSTGNPPDIIALLLGIHQVKFEGGCRVNFNKAGKRFSKTSPCDAVLVAVAEDAIRRYEREQRL